ncbi:MAG: glycosyltransferase [Solirubrobacterales bacterium]|nr:glycosyltransferase [Solirubrobacterales bacterium]
MPATAVRPSVDVVVPFCGSTGGRQAVMERMGTLALRSDDSLIIVDNSPVSQPGPPSEQAQARVLLAPGLATPGFARNRGAACGSGEWIVFLDADVEPIGDLLDRYFEFEPAARTGLLAGGILDEEVPADGPLAARYAYLRGAMSQQDTFDFGSWGYPKSANIACRRVAYEAVGGFREDIRAAEDADLTYRLKAAGWEVERRESATVEHLSRGTVWQLIKQKARWGAGGAWLNRTYPGSVPLISGGGTILWAVTATARELRGLIRRRDRDAAIYALLRPVDALAWEFGRFLSNEQKPSDGRLGGGQRRVLRRARAHPR